MERWLPLGYFALLIFEAIALVALYAVVQPEPGGLLNIAVGTVGLGSMIVMLVYSIARRSRALRNVARLSAWLHLHIFLGLQGVLFVLVHSSTVLYSGGGFNPLNPGMLNLYAVLVVIASGVFGRYLFAQVPRTLGGQHLAAKALEAELASLDEPLPDGVAALWASAPGGRGLSGLAAAHRSRTAALRALAAMRLDPAVASLAERRIVLERQKAILTTAQRWFRSWIFLHRPIAAMLYTLSFIHVVLSLMFSAHFGGS